MSAPPPSPAAGRPGYANYVLAILFGVYVLNFVDRQVLAILLPSIKAEFGASDTLMGFLTGPAFALFYTVLGIPIARWADRGTRRSIIALGLALWSAMTVACGLSQSFVQLAAARVGVGVGEAAGSPPAHSLLSDYFPPERRATALGLYATGAYWGGMLAFVGGAWLVTHFEWRTAFLAVGLPGLPFALLLRATVREPSRGAAESGPVDTTSRSLGEVLGFLRRRRTFHFLVLACSIVTLPGYAVLAWAPTFLVRLHETPMLEVGLWLGLGMGLGGGFGAWLGGRIADRLGLGDPRWLLWVPILGVVTSLPFVLAFLLLEDTRLAVAAFFAYQLLAAFYVGPMYGLTQSLVRVRMRALTSAILLFVMNLVGLGAGPLVAGFLNDTFAARFGTAGIRWSLVTVASFALLGVPFYLLAARHVRRELADRES